MNVFPNKILSKIRREFAWCRLKFLHWLSKEEDFFVDHGWIKLLFSDDGDVQELYYHMNSDVYFNNDMRIFQKYISEGDTVVDVGANMGFVAAMLARRVGSSGRVYCFEPSSRAYAKLLKTIQANNLDQIESYNLGCGAKKEEASLKLSASSGNNSIANVQYETGEVENIQVVSLDSITALKSRSVEFIKIDTEGYETEVLLGAGKLIKRCKPVIFIELSGVFMENTLNALRILENYGYKVDVSEDIDWDEIGDGANFIATPHSS